MARKQLPDSKRFIALIATTLMLMSGASAKPKFRVVYNFKGGNDPGGPSGGALVVDCNGNLFGTAAGGSDQCNGGCGTVFELSPGSAAEWTETVLHRFDYSQQYGDGVSAGLVADEEGDLYGSTPGGQAGGLFFEITSRGSWNQFVLPDGGSGAVLHFDDAGTLFAPGGGGVFELTRDSGSWMQNVIYTFPSSKGTLAHNGDDPIGSLISDAVGNLYGVTQFGGNLPPLCPGGAGCGIAYELTPHSDGGWTEKVLHLFASSKDDGQLPQAGLVMDSSGNLYGTTMQGGKHQAGTIFQLSPAEDGEWQERILYDFSNPNDGGAPAAALLFDGFGNLYGTAAGGQGSCDRGVVFKLAPPGPTATWRYRVLHRFCGGDGELPSALALDDKGNLYGTSGGGGLYLYGTAFELVP
jgi:uncharacterized repeat protein (TIGR03803 family)